MPDNSPWIFTGQPPEGDGNNIRFVTEVVQNEAKSALEARPIFDEKHFVEVAQPGVTNQVGSFEVKPGKNGFGGNTYYKRYSKAYDAWIAGDTELGSGTPLSELPFLSKAAVAELKAMKFNSVESLAGLADVALGGLPAVFMSYRDKAKAYLDKAAGLAPLTAMQKQIDDLKAALAAEKEDKKNLAAAASTERKKLTLGKSEAAA